VEQLSHRFVLEVRKALHTHLAANGLEEARNTARRLQGGSRPGVSNDKAVLDAILRGGAFLQHLSTLRKCQWPEKKYLKELFAFMQDINPPPPPNTQPDHVISSPVLAEKPLMIRIWWR
jgi:hypothetical protein